MAESGALTSYSHRVFTAWDFGLCGDVHVRLRQRIILYELQVRVRVGSTSREGPRGAGLGDSGRSFLRRRRASGNERAGRTPL